MNLDQYYHHLEINLCIFKELICAQELGFISFIANESLIIRLSCH